MDAIDLVIVELVKQWDAMSGAERETPRGHAILNDVQLIGQTAAFFGGYGAMKKLHDAAENRVGNDNSVGYWINRMWDGVGSWLS
jgi:hypothetical protein